MGRIRQAGWRLALALAVGASAAGCAGSRGSAAGVAGTGPVPAGPGTTAGAGIHASAAPDISVARLPAGGSDRGRELPPPNSGALEPAPERTGEAEEGAGSALRRIHFGFDQHILTAEARDILAKNAEQLFGNGRMGVLVEGHCDERGTTEYNLALGERRAESARRYLQDLGVAPGRMAVVTFGEERPLDSGRSEEAWAQNRRAEFRVVRP